MKQSEEVVELVIARLQAMPESLKVHLGNNVTLVKSDLIEHVQNQDDFGLKIIEMQMKYLRQLKNGF